jgi:carotenoid cleavage dioxygenase
VRDEVLVVDDPGELPTRDPRLVGREHRYGYLVQTRPSDDTVDMGGVIKHDFATGRRELWDPGPNVHSGEWLFVPDPDSRAEDAGWLMAFVYDATTDRSALTILDATNVRKGPIARINTPQRVPYGFHATWVPA